MRDALTRLVETMTAYDESGESVFADFTKIVLVSFVVKDKPNILFPPDDRIVIIFDVLVAEGFIKERVNPTMPFAYGTMHFELTDAGEYLAQYCEQKLHPVH